jgi:hypothetical protein
MALNGALLLLIRSFSAAMLMASEKKHFVWFWIADMAIYLTLKVARSDFVHWVPLDNAILRFVFSLTMRVSVKTVADYTGLIQFRGPGELGGAYWAFNTCNALLISLFAADFYFTNVALTEVDGDKEFVALREKEVWPRLLGLVGAWIFTFASVMVLTKKKYWSTFISLETGNEWAQNRYLRGNNDAQKSFIFHMNKEKWKPIRREVEAWVRANWWKWKEERPEWFTEKTISLIPFEFIPVEDIRFARETRRSVRRRSSFGSAFALGGSATIIPEGEEEDEEEGSRND